MTENMQTNVYTVELNYTTLERGANVLYQIER